MAASKRFRILALAASPINTLRWAAVPSRRRAAQAPGDSASRAAARVRTKNVTCGLLWMPTMRSIAAGTSR
jgi:hypothetical protein